MTRHLRCFTAMAAVAVLTASGTVADTLYLRAGEQEPGRLLAITGKEVRFEGPNGVKTWRKADVLRIQLQRARTFDDVQAADQITEPDLRTCLDKQPGAADFPSAGFVTLLRRQVYDLTQPGVVVDTVRAITKVLQQRGEDVATTSVWYFEDTDTPTIDFALTVTADGRVLHLSDDALKNESIYAQFPDYRRLARFRFACKEPRPGSVLDVQYTVIRKLDAPIEPFYGEEVFRDDQPILRQEVVVLVPEAAESRVTSELGGPDVIEARRQVDNGVVRLTWVLTQPQLGILPEPLMPPKEEFAPRLVLGESASREDIARAYAAALAALPDLPRELAEKAIALDTEGGPQAIHDFIARTVRIAPVPHQAYRAVPHPAGETSHRGMANELDKNYLYFKMLEAAGIPCAFALVRGRGQGPLADSVPSLQAFNRSAVYLKAEDRFETAAGDLLPFGALPGGMHNAPALVVDAAGGALTTTQQPSPEEELNATQFEAVLDVDGNLALNLTYTGTANMGVWMRDLKDADAQRLRNTFQQIAGYVHPAARLVDYTTTDLADLAVTPVITLQCSIPGYAVKAGDDLILFNLPAVDYTAGEVGRPTREHDLFWEHVERETKEGAIRIPAGYEVYSMPESVDFDSPTASYNASLALSEGSIAFGDRYELKVQDAPPEAYGEYKACRELRANIPRQRVILTR